MTVISVAKSSLGQPILLHLRPPGDRRHDEAGYCWACGIHARFAFNSWTISRQLRRFWDDPRVSIAYARRESMFCRRCCASLRVRRIAEVLVSLYGPTDCKSLAELTGKPIFRDLEVAEVNAIGAADSLHKLLRKLPNLAFSDYRGPERLGQLVDGTRNEDICRLTYADSNFDLVLSSDTLEHVHDFRAALLRWPRRVGCYALAVVTSSPYRPFGHAGRLRPVRASATTAKSSI